VLSRLKKTGRGRETVKRTRNGISEERQKVICVALEKEMEELIFICLCSLCL
jgi:hypothetical protein